MTKDSFLGIRLPSTAKAQLRVCAESDHRTVSSLTTKIILDWLAAAQQSPTGMPPPPRRRLAAPPS